MQRLHLVIAGRVQGVGFRRAAQREALQRGLHGWVRNRLDGRVECLVEGSPEALKSFEAWCREGPLFARVREVEAEWQEGPGEFEGFTVR